MSTHVHAHAHTYMCVLSICISYKTEAKILLRIHALPVLDALYFVFYLLKKKITAGYNLLK